VLHFAGKKSVPESVENPLLYYREKGGMTALLGAMVSAGVGKLVPRVRGGLRCAARRW
jgi:UDP-glucose 4-epimerase